MKKLPFIFTLLIFYNYSFAQTNFYKLKAGLGAGGVITYADLNKKPITFAAYGTLDYMATPYVSLGIELQKGQLAGGDIIFDPYNRQFTNSYISGTVNLRISFGEFITDNQRRNDFLNFFSGAYVGVGFGLIKNKVSNVRTYDTNYYPGDDASTEKVLPVNLGFNINFPDKWGYDRYALNVNLQSTLDYHEGLDGYTPFKGKNDIYSFFSVGLKYQFGFMGLDKRR